MATYVSEGSKEITCRLLAFDIGIRVLHRWDGLGRHSVLDMRISNSNRRNLKADSCISDILGPMVVSYLKKEVNDIYQHDNARPARYVLTFHDT